MKYDVIGALIPFIYGLKNKTDFITLLILIVQEVKIIQIPLKC